jgi:drug/metabolite transporter (DMT)-like permease
MTTFAPDGSAVTRAAAPRSRLGSGLGFAVLSAAAFGMSGALARGLLDTGWSAGAAVLVRVMLGALVVAPFGLVALRGRWHLLRENVGLIAVYGGLAVAGAQFCYFSAIQYMQVGPALLIEYTAPAAVVGWMWARHGHRPGPVTLAGVAVAALGLVLVLDVVSGAELSAAGVAWALAAMVGAATYFIINGKGDTGLHPLTLAAGGLVVGALALGILGATGLMPLTGSTAPAQYPTGQIPWWVALALLGVVTAGMSYVTGIAAGRRLGSRLSSFVALLEVVCAIGFAWLVLHELPRPVQLLGGVLILAGVVAVQQGERATARAGRRRARSAVSQDRATSLG